MRAPREHELERSLPHSAEAEGAILGGILLDNRLMEEALALNVQPDDFYLQSHVKIYSAMIETHKQLGEINPILIGDILGHDQLKAVGGISFITDLTYGLPHTTSLKHYIRVLHGKATLRWTVKEAARITEDALAEDDDAETVVGRASDNFNRVRERIAVASERGGEGPELHRLYDDHLYLLKAGVNPSIATGLEELDHLTGGGIAPGELWGIGALSSQGKTTLLLQWLRSMAKRGVPCVLFSLEMGLQLIALRMGAIESGVSVKSINFRTPHSHLDYLLSKSGPAFEHVPAVYTDCRSIGQIRNRIQSLKRKHPIKVIGIDYYGLLSGYGAGRDRYENRTQELKYISSALQQQIAIEEGVAVIVPAQFNRSAWGAKDIGPANIDGGEAFHQACDLFATLETKPGKANEKETKASLNIQKHRNGPLAKIDLIFNRELMEFRPRPEDEGDADEPEPDTGRYG